MGSKHVTDLQGLSMHEGKEPDINPLWQPCTLARSPYAVPERLARTACSAARAPGSAALHFAYFLAA